MRVVDLLHQMSGILKDRVQPHRIPYLLGLLLIYPDPLLILPLALLKVLVLLILLNCQEFLPVDPVGFIGDA